MRKAVTLQDAADAARCFSSPCYFSAAFTDQYQIGIWNSTPLNGDEDKLIELRIFNEQGEIKLIRSDIGKGFLMRVQDQDETKEYFDVHQFLDIDTKIPLDEAGRVTATGGGQYWLPGEVACLKNARLLVRNYIKYTELTGQAYIYDWRCVRFEEVK